MSLSRKVSNLINKLILDGNEQEPLSKKYEISVNQTMLGLLDKLDFRW